MKHLTAITLLLLICCNCIAQYTVNGNATQDNCHCYTLTQALPTQSGSVWNNNKINLAQSFTFTFNVFLGSNDGGADGIAFVMQPISTSIGGNGSGMGYGGIVPGAAVTLDTYQNLDPDNDPFYDHIAIQLNGDVNHSSINTLTPPTPILATSNNVEDGLSHILKISWDAVAHTLIVYFDGQLRLNATRDLVNTVFGGNSMVFWGFTGATGGLNNLQQFCTTLTPNFHLLPDQKRCIGEPISFYDSTVTFGGILKRYWNFGDGSPIDSVNINPTHTYLTAGDFTVTLSVIAIDSCSETFTQVVRVGSKPVANFIHQLDSCVNLQVQYVSTSTAAVGSIISYYWDLDNSTTSSAFNPVTTYPDNGIKNIRLFVKTSEGCESDTLIKPVHIYAKTVSDFTVVRDSVCLGSAMNFLDNSTWADGAINGWYWNFGDGSVSNDQNPSYTFTTAGVHTVLIGTVGIHPSCMGLKSKNVFVVNKPTAYFKWTPACQFSQMILQDSSFTTDGFTISQWWWDLGNGQFSTLQNPPVTYNTPGIKSIRLVVTNSRGCISDTIMHQINISAKPVADFDFNSNVCTGIPVQFSDSSVISSGTIRDWTWIEHGSIWSTLQNPSSLLNAGSHTIALLVTSADGCVSDTTFRSFVINVKPAVSMAFQDECKKTPVQFTGIVNSGIINEWFWSFGDGGSGNIISPMHAYAANGNYPIVLYAIDQFGCSTDSVHESINIYGTNAFAGNDTIAAAGQPVQLNASGGLSYEWSPVTGLNNPSLANPISILNATQIYLLKAYTPEGCESYDSIEVKIYNGPEIYLPNAFTPNGDGLNDIFRGIMVGLKEFHYLKVFNRWGQEIYSTTDYRKGWDGKWKSVNQEPGVYVILVSGTDFTGKPISKKGTVLLIR